MVHMMAALSEPSRRLSPQEAMDRLRIVLYKDEWWPALCYDNYDQILQYLSRDMNPEERKNVFIDCIKRKSQVPMAQLLGWEEGNGGSFLVRMSEIAKSELFWQGPGIDWWLIANANKQDSSGKMGRAVKILENIVTEASTSADSMVPNNDNTTLQLVQKSSYAQAQPTDQPRPIQATNSPETVIQEPDSQQRQYGENSVPAAQVAASENTFIEFVPNESWEQVWAKMGRIGWKKRTDSEEKYFYVKPGKMWSTGNLGEDFFDNLEDVQEFARKQYGWKGGDDAKNVTKTARKVKTGKKKRKQSTPFLPKRQKERTDSPDRVWGSETKHSNKSTTESKKKSKGLSNKRSHNGVRISSFYVFNNLIKILRKIGWKIVRATNVLHDWYYIVPGRSVKDGILGVDYFDNSEQVIRYCQEQNYHVVYGSPESESSTISGDQLEADATPPKRINCRPEKAVYDSPATETPITQTAWWHSQPPPLFLDVWNILQKLGVRFLGGRYVVPYAPQKDKFFSGRFENNYDLQRFLCMRGIPDYEANQHKLTEEEKLILYRWMSFANVSNRRPEKIKHLELLSNDDAWRLLSMAGFKFNGEEYTHGTSTFNSMDELRGYVRSLENIDNISAATSRRNVKSILNDDQHLMIQLWAASSELPFPDFQVPETWVSGVLPTKEIDPSSSQVSSIQSVSIESGAYMMLTQDPGPDREKHHHSDDDSWNPETLGFQPEDGADRKIPTRVSLD